MTAGSTYDFAITGTGNAGSISIVATGVASTDVQAIKTAYDALGADSLTGAAAVLATTAGKTFGIEVVSVRTATEVAAGVTSAQSIYTATTAIATANAAQVAVSNGTVGTQSFGGAQYSGQAFANALNTALASATGGAAVNGSVVSTAGTLTYVAGTTDSLQFGLTGATDAATALTIQTAVSTATGLTTAQLGMQAGVAVNAANHGTVTLNSSSTNGVVVGGANVAYAGLSTGVTAATTVSSVSAISAVDVSTASGAVTALTAIDGALTTVNSARANLGAIQNRFSSVVSSLGTTVENLTASRSRIVDTDFAAETAQLTRAQILQQAGTAMLAQANAIPNTVLTLLR
jgi:flagellin